MKQQINLLGKITAGFFLILFTAGAGMMIVAYWPDKLPGPKDNIAPLYMNELFHVRLVGIPDTPCNAECSYYGDCDTLLVKTNQSIDSVKTGADSLDRRSNYLAKKNNRSRLLHINTIILILVALGGFIGNMIHVATSFTTFVGDKKFEQSWILWYCVKPFSASALSIGFYFVFRGGFLNISDDATNINLYGLMTISILTGLFTDTATLKLKEVFEVLFKPKDQRTGKRGEETVINSVDPLLLEMGKANAITISGTNMNNTKLIVSINDQVIGDPSITAATITFDYTIPDDQKDKNVFRLLIKDEAGKELKAFELKVKPITPVTGIPSGTTDDAAK